MQSKSSTTNYEHRMHSAHIFGSFFLSLSSRCDTIQILMRRFYYETLNVAGTAAKRNPKFSMTATTITVTQKATSSAGSICSRRDSRLQESPFHFRNTENSFLSHTTVDVRSLPAVVVAHKHAEIYTHTHSHSLATRAFIHFDSLKGPLHHYSILHIS